MTEHPRQKCKHCGTEVTGHPAVSAGGGPVGPGGKLVQPFPLAYSFMCSGKGPHGDKSQGRSWIWEVPDPLEGSVSV